MSKVDTLKAVAAELTGKVGIIKATLWDRVPGKERVYVSLTKSNGGKNWNGGIGHSIIVHADGKVEYDRNTTWAGAATRKGHEQVGTFEMVEEVAAKHFSS